MTKIAITGDRHYTDFITIANYIEPRIKPEDEIITGDATGVDTIVASWATYNHRHLTVYKADWNKYGKAAGPIRNQKIAINADHLIVFYGGGPGSKNMIKQMATLGKSVDIIDINP